MISRSPEDTATDFLELYFKRGLYFISEVFDNVVFDLEEKYPYDISVEEYGAVVTFLVSMQEIITEQEWDKMSSKSDKKCSATLRILHSWIRNNEYMWESQFDLLIHSAFHAFRSDSERMIALLPSVIEKNLRGSDYSRRDFGIAIGCYGVDNAERHLNRVIEEVNRRGEDEPLSKLRVNIPLARVALAMQYAEVALFWYVDREEALSAEACDLANSLCKEAHGELAKIEDVEISDWMEVLWWQFLTARKGDNILQAHTILARYTESVLPGISSSMDSIVLYHMFENGFEIVKSALDISSNVSGDRSYDRVSSSLIQSIDEEDDEVIKAHNNFDLFREKLKIIAKEVDFRPLKDLHEEVDKFHAKMEANKNR